MNTCYYYQDLLPRQVHASIPTRFSPTRVSALLVCSMIAQDDLLDRFIRDSARYGFAGRTSSIFRATSFGWRAVTHSLADAGFHGHCPAVVMRQHLLMVSTNAFESLTGHKFEPFLPSLLTNVAH